MRQRPTAVAVIVTAALLFAACGSGSPRPGAPDRPTTAASRSAGPAGPPPSIAAADRAACAQLYSRLQRVTAALDASSRLLTNSLNTAQLSGQIAIEQQQLSRSADLLTQGPVPAPLAATTRDLAGALRAFSADFAQAKAAAARSDLLGAVQAMTDKPVVNRIISAATTIEHACR